MTNGRSSDPVPPSEASQPILESSVADVLQFTEALSPNLTTTSPGVSVRGQTAIQKENHIPSAFDKYEVIKSIYRLINKDINDAYLREVYIPFRGTGVVTAGTAAGTLMTSFLTWIEMDLFVLPRSLEAVQV